MAKHREVMLVDDEPIDLFICEKLLMALDFASKVIKYQEAKNGINELRTRLEQGKKLPEIIFLDFFMPDMNGQEFIQKIRELKESHADAFSEVKIVVLTSLKNSEKRRMLEAQESVYKVMSKPINETSLLELTRLLSSQTA